MQEQLIKIQELFNQIENVFMIKESLKEYELRVLFDNKDDPNYFMVLPFKDATNCKYERVVFNGPIFDAKTLKVLWWNGQKDYTNIKSTVSLPGVFYTDDVNEMFTDENTRYSLLKYHEGTLIKVFHSGGEWHLATSSCIDGYKSRHLSRKSFGDYFKEAVPEDFYDALDPNFSYTYILTVPLVNTVFSQTQDIEINLVSKFNKETLTVETVEDNYLIKKPMFLDEIYHYLQKQENCLKDNLLYKNFILIDETQNNRIKLVNPNYVEYSNIIHNTNTASLFNRIVELRADGIELSRISSISPQHQAEYKKFMKHYHALSIKLQDHIRNDKSTPKSKSHFNALVSVFKKIYKGDPNKLNTSKIYSILKKDSLTGLIISCLSDTLTNDLVLGV